jgi:hypothetical protein
MKNIVAIISTFFLIGCGQQAGNGNISNNQTENQSAKLNTDLTDQNCEKCNIELLNIFSKKIENPSYIEYQNFICTFDEKCKANSEFTEYGNDLLFQSILTNPYFLNESLYNLGDRHLQLILIELANPVSDSYDLQKVYNVIKGLNDGQEIIELEKNAIIQAAEKLGIKIKE